MWVVQEKGLLKKMGVDAEIIGINSSPIAMQALLAGDVDVIVTSVTTLVGTRLAGADTIMIQTLVPTFVDHIVSLSSITALQHLKGKTGGVNRVGSTSDLGLAFSAPAPWHQSGIGYQDYYGRRQSGETRRFVARLYSVYDHARAVGARGREVRLSRFVGYGIFGSAFSLERGSHSGEHHKNQAQLACEGRARHHRRHSFHQDRQRRHEGDLQKVSQAQRPRGTGTSGESLCEIFPINTLPTPEGVKTLLDDMAPRNPKAKAADPRQYVDVSFVQELESSGYIKQLYKR